MVEDLSTKIFSSLFAPLTFAGLQNHFPYNYVLTKFIYSFTSLQWLFAQNDYLVLYDNIILSQREIVLLFWNLHGVIFGVRRMSEIW